MHVQTHGLFGWAVANLFPLTGRQRLAALIAGVVPDVDGLGIVFGQEAYWDYHHVVGHNLLFGVIASAALTAWSRGRAGVFVLCLAVFHSHLVMDYWGSGPDWPILYWWPFSREKIVNPHAWPLFSWQNITAFAIVFAWSLRIAIRHGRTPLEVVMPALDQKIVAWLRSAARVAPDAPLPAPVPAPAPLAAATAAEEERVGHR